MTRQEEIREGIENRLASLLVLCGVPQQKARQDAREFVGAWFKWMASQGVVVKVDDGGSPFGFRLESFKDDK